MLTFNQGAMREHLRLYLQAKSSRRLKIVFTAELKILLPSSLHNFFTMPSKNFTPYICIVSHSRVHIPHHDQQVTTCHPPNRPGASRRNSSLHTTIFGGRIYLHLYQFYLYTLFQLYFWWAHIPAFISILFVYTVSFVFLPNIGLTVLLLLPNSSTFPLLNFSN